MPLHQLAEHRINRNRDLKMIITAKDSQTGVGKTTLAGWLALQWTKHFTGDDWWVDREEWGVGLGTLHPREYFSILGKIPDTHPAGSVVIVDDAEELDARRSMSGTNVEFSQRWMLMRLKQAITIITLPSPKAIDSRLEELSDVWVNIQRRGKGMVHDIRVNSYDRRNVMTEQKHEITWPDVSGHPELEKLRAMKEDKMDEWDTEEEEAQEEVDPKEVKREQKVEIAQRLRDNGVPILSQDGDTQDIAGTIDMSQSWISKNTESPDN